MVVSVDADGTPVQVRRLGEARIGAALPQGVVTRDGKGEAVTGTVLMLVGQNSRDVVHAVKAKIEELRTQLPEGARIETVYDRASFIDRTLQTVGKNLLEGALLVGIVILVFLRNWRISLLVTFGIPMSMVIALFGMLKLDVTGSLMSLGAIDFGLLVDGPIVMAEALMARLALEHATAHNRVSVITRQPAPGDAARGVLRADHPARVRAAAHARGHRGQDVPAHGHHHGAGAVRLGGVLAVHLSGRRGRLHARGAARSRPAGQAGRALPAAGAAGPWRSAAC